MESRRHSQIPSPFECELNFFLAGASQTIEINKLFSVSFQQVVRSFPAGEMVFGAQRQSVRQHRYYFCDVSCGISNGVALFSPATDLVGIYLGASLAIHDKHQGMGLGAELVFEYAQTVGALPTWHMDVAAYSPAGYQAHCRAWKLARDQSFLRAKEL